MLNIEIDITSIFMGLIEMLLVYSDVIIVHELYGADMVDDKRHNMGIHESGFNISNLLLGSVS